MSAPAQLRVLHALRLKNLTDTAPLAELAGLDLDAAQVLFGQLADDQLIRFREGAITGWTLLPAGRDLGQQLLAEELDAAGKRSDLEALYGRFLERNQPFLSLCSDWQTRSIDGQRVRNDHGDPDYDATVIARLNEIATAMQPVWAQLGALLDRFGHYGPRFAAALSQLNAGATDWFTSPRIDSYHTVWFELHEDLLASLGIERAKEVQI